MFQFLIERTSVKHFLFIFKAELLAKKQPLKTSEVYSDDEEEEEDDKSSEKSDRSSRTSSSDEEEE